VSRGEVDASTREAADGRVQRHREAHQRRVGRLRGLGLEVLDVARIHGGSGGDILNIEAQLGAAVGDATTDVAGVT
jgi:hypothetical protein